MPQRGSSAVHGHTVRPRGSGVSGAHEREHQRKGRKAGARARERERERESEAGTHTHLEVVPRLTRTRSCLRQFCLSPACVHRHKQTERERERERETEDSQPTCRRPLSLCRSPVLAATACGRPGHMATEYRDGFSGDRGRGVARTHAA